jgi:hypothetical protein
MIRQAVIVAGLVCLVLLLAACGTAARTTAKEAIENAPGDATGDATGNATGNATGVAGGDAKAHDHLGRYAAEAAVAKGQAIDPAARQAILSEPALRFPARIGLARLETGALSAVPQGEAEAWLAMVQDLGPGWGELVPISPLVVAEDGPQGGDAVCGTGTRDASAPCGSSDIAVLLGSLRRAAIRHRLDAILIYEMVAESARAATSTDGNEPAPLSALLRLVAADGAAGRAQGVLMDARHGAVYGFAEGAAEDAWFGDRDVAAVAALTRETGIMLRELRIELAEARAARAEAGNQSGFRSN